MHVDMYLNAPGPEVPDVHYDEMGEQDLRNLMAYLHASLNTALQHGVDESVTDVIREWYDEVFTALAGISEHFRESVFNGFVFPPGGPGVRSKYVAIAREASES